MASDKIEFINPSTGESQLVAPTRACIELAERLGYVPYSEDDQDAADAVMLR